MSVLKPDPSNDPILFEIREVLDRLIDDVDALVTNQTKDFDAALLSPQEKDGEFLDHADKCSSCTQVQVFGILGDDEGIANDLDWNPDGYERFENLNGDRSLSSLEGSSGSDISWDEFLVALLSIPNNAIGDEGSDNADAIDVVQSNEEDVGDRDFDVLEGSDTSWDDIFVALLSIPNDDGVEHEGFEDGDDASSEEEIGGVVMDVVQWNGAPNEEVAGDAEDVDDQDDDFLDVLMMFLAEPEVEEQQQLGSGDHPQERGGNVLDEMD